MTGTRASGARRADKAGSISLKSAACIRGIRETWSEAGEASGERVVGGEQILKSRSGFGYHVRQATTRPSNTAVRDLLAV